MTEAATYTPLAGSPVSVSALVVRPIENQSFGNLDLALPQTILRVRVSEVAAPVAGDAVELASVSYLVDSVQLDATGKVWELGVH